MANPDERNIAEAVDFAALWTHFHQLYQTAHGVPAAASGPDLTAIEAAFALAVQWQASAAPGGQLPVALPPPAEAGAALQSLPDESAVAAAIPAAGPAASSVASPVASDSAPATAEAEDKPSPAGPTGQLPRLGHDLGTTGNDQLTGNDAANLLMGRGGDDVLTGLGGRDLLFGGTGADIFVVQDVSHSTGLRYDMLLGFDPAADRIDIAGSIGSIAASVAGGTLSRGSFDADLEAALGAAQLGAGQALLFTPDEGHYAGRTFLVADGNGVAGYQAGEDYVWLILMPGAADIVITPDLFI
jgi:hypothetical protein